MIKKIGLTNWKSFSHTTLYVEQLSFIIGTNASGKSNALDALSFLKHSATGATLNECVKQTRGGTDWMIMRGQTTASLSVVVSEDGADYTYSLTIEQKDNTIRIAAESLTRQTAKTIPLFVTGETSESGTIPVCLYTGKQGRRRIDLYANTSILTQIVNMNVLKEIKSGARAVLENLKNIFILNPQPAKMRQYVPLSEQLDDDGGNIAGVLAGMDVAEKQSTESIISKYLNKLPERDVQRLWAEKIGPFGTDAMLYCDEEWTDNHTITLDARGMSDGTLRFISIIMALLTRPEHSLLVVEEIDNGLHPSRTKELIEVLSTLSHERRIDVMCTTHNPVLIDTLGNSMIDFISVVKRSPSDGSSIIIRLEDMSNLLSLLAEGTMGNNMTRNKI